MINFHRTLGACTVTCDCCGAPAPASRPRSEEHSPLRPRGWVFAVGPRRGRYRERYDVCPTCHAADRLPAQAERPQPAWARKAAQQVAQGAVLGLGFDLVRSDFSEVEAHAAVSRLPECQVGS